MLSVLPVAVTGALYLMHNVQGSVRKAKTLTRVPRGSVLRGSIEADDGRRTTTDSRASGRRRAASGESRAGPEMTVCSEIY